MTSNPSLQHGTKAPAPFAQNLQASKSIQEKKGKTIRGRAGNISQTSTRCLEVNVIFSPIICTLILHETIFHKKKSLFSCIRQRKRIRNGPNFFRKVGCFSFHLAFLITPHTRRQIINIMIYTGKKRALRIMAPQRCLLLCYHSK